MLDNSVYLVEDDKDLSTSIIELLSTVSIHCQPFYNGLDFLAAVNHSPVRGCALFDVHLPGMSGLSLQQELLKNKQIHLPVIFITGYADVEIAVQAMKAGAFDFLLKPFNAEVLLEKIQKALRFSEHYHQSILTVKARFVELTERERTILAKLIAGKINKVIADELGISIKTVEAHRASIMQKTGAKTIAELVKLTIAADLN